MSPSTFTSGPRGRRVLLELAMMVSDDLTTAVFERGIAIDIERGATGIVVGVVEGQAQEGPEFAARVAASAPTPAEVGGILDRVVRPGEGPGEEEFGEALRRSVQDARYWQEPSATDVLAGMRELRGPLRRFAAWAAPHAPASWDEQMSPAQHAIGWGRTPIIPTDPSEPSSGTWWSTPPGAVSSAAPGGIPTALVYGEDFGGGPARSAPVDASAARVLSIDNTGVWNTLCWDQPLEITAARRHDWYRVSGLDTRWVIPDWALLAKKYDAVHLRVGAYLSGATHALTVDTGINTMIAGWGPGETRWLNAPDLGEPTRWAFNDADLTWCQAP